MGTNVKVDGIAFYASLLSPNKEAEAYTLELVVDKENEAQLLEAGLSPAKNKHGELVRHGELEGNVFRFKAKTHKKDGTPLRKPDLIDSLGKKVDVFVGNGSKVRVYANAYDYTFKGKKGVSAGLNAVQILDLVEFTRFDKVDNGFVGTETSEQPQNIEDII